jgi:hypothetical protein
VRRRAGQGRAAQLSYICSPPTHLASQRNSGCRSAARRLPPGINSIATSSSWFCR